jgi:AcrR family transcriptional regulator
MGVQLADTAPHRSDAVRNHNALVSAARTVFGARGLDAPLDEIARRAGVGNATLYRHFATRRELVAAVFTQTLQDIVDATERALSMPDGWDAFATYVTFLCELQAADRGLADLLTISIHGAPQLETLQVRASEGFARLAARAKAEGALREDFQPEDLVLLLMANAGLVHRAATAAPTSWRRVLSYTLDGLGAVAAEKAAPSPGLEAVQSAMSDLAERFGCG